MLIFANRRKFGGLCEARSLPNIRRDAINDDQLKEILKRDPVAEYERVFGKMRPETASKEACLSILGHAMGVNKIKSESLKQADDADFSCDLTRYLRIIHDIGFRKVLDIPFRGKHDKSHEEHFCVFWREDGILLKFDTYGGDHVNGGEFHYNWKPNETYTGRENITSSCSWEYVSDEARVRCESVKPKWIGLDASEYEKAASDQEWSEWNKLFRQNAVMVGYHDCREAIRFSIRQLEKYGSFCKPWVPDKHPSIWFYHHGDEYDKDDHKSWKKMADEKTKERLALLPKEVRDGMGL